MTGCTMKNYCKKTLWSKIILGILATGCMIFLLYRNESRLCNEQAKTIFRKALVQELQKRDTVSVFHWTNKETTLFLEENIPDVVKIETELGEKEYRIPSEKYQYSIVKDETQRGLLTYLLSENPLNVDSINVIWDSLLTTINPDLKTYTRVSITDLEGYITSSYSKINLSSVPADSLCSYYIGARCEIEVTGFIFYHWWDILSFRYILIVGLLWLLIGSLFYLGKKIYCWIKLKLVEEKIVIIEKEVPVIPVETEKSCTYQLGKDFYFDVERKMLKKDGIIRRLAPQVTDLFVLFLRNKYHKISVKEICAALWPDSSGTVERVHTVMRRLRKSLSSISELQINYEHGEYQLIIPHFIEKNEITDDVEVDVPVLTDTGK